jgi:hypothetical protein
MAIRPLLRADKFQRGCVPQLGRIAMRPYDTITIFRKQ